MKWGRTYKLYVETTPVGSGQALKIEYPLTIEFDVTRNTLSSMNRAHITVKNLNEATRKKIFHDRFDYTTYKLCVLEAGYESQTKLSTIFRGNIMFANSSKRGVDWFTEIEAIDGIYGTMNSNISTSIPSGYSAPQLFRTIFSSLQNVEMGKIGNIDTKSSRGITLSGNSWTIASDLSKTIAPGSMCFIDKEKANILADGDYIRNTGGVEVITSESGLIETPRRGEKTIDVKMIFEPNVQIGQIVELRSIETVNNGQYQVIGFKHSGTISGAVCGAVETTLTLYQPNILKAI